MLIVEGCCDCKVEAAAADNLSHIASPSWPPSADVADRPCALSAVMHGEREPDIACMLGFLIGAGVEGSRGWRSWHFTTSPAFR
jgi:hypothetical protein